MKNKVKTKSAAKKRFKKTGKNKIKRCHAYHRHLLTKKGRKKKRHLRQGAYVSSADKRRIMKLLPYS